MWIHRISGAIILALTLYYGLKAWKTLGWKVLPNAHSVFVFPTLASILFVAMGGIASRSMLRRQVWNTKAALLVKRAHKIFAYLLLLVSQGALATGMHFYRINPKHASTVPLEWIHLVAMAAVVAVLEYRHQLSLSEQEPFSCNTSATITLDDFSARL